MAQTLNSLALLYYAQGKYEQAEPLLKRALTIRKKQFGPEHLNTATTLNNLAALYYSQGKYEQAEPLLKRALTILEEQLGLEHPTTVTLERTMMLLLRRCNKRRKDSPNIPQP